MASKRSRPVVNKYKVPKAQWDKWSNDARRVFNRLYHEMRPACQWIFVHPKAQILPREQWQTTRWNAAWAAADAVDRQPIKNRYVTVYGKKG